VRQLLGRVCVLELIGEMPGRAAEPFPVAVRTPDALHLASFDFLRREGARLAAATYDGRLLNAGRALDFPVNPLD
jgi:hypothetical protein